MQQLIFFSHYFKALWQTVKFVFIIVARFISIIFRKRKNISLLQFDYSNKYLFDKSYLIISYGFKNALWIKIGKSRTLMEKNFALINIQKLENTAVDFIVFGFFQKKKWHITLSPSYLLKNGEFITKVVAPDIQKYCSGFFVYMPKANILIPTSNLKIFPIRINTSPYKQADYI